MHMEDTLSLGPRVCVLFSLLFITIIIYLSPLSSRFHPCFSTAFHYRALQADFLARTRQAAGAPPVPIEFSSGFVAISQLDPTLFFLLLPSVRTHPANLVPSLAPPGPR